MIYYFKNWSKRITSSPYAQLKKVEFIEEAIMYEQPKTTELKRTFNFYAVLWWIFCP